MENEINNPNETPAAAPNNSSAKKWIIIGVVALLLLFILQSIFFSPERMAERMLERAGGGEYDITIDNDGSYTATNDGETIDVRAGDRANIPDNWPSSIPVPAEAAIDYSTVVTGENNDTISTLNYTTTASVSSVADIYATALTTNGWTISAQLATGADRMFSAEHADGEMVSVYISPVAENTAVMISVQSPQ